MGVQDGNRITVEMRLRDLATRELDQFGRRAKQTGQTVEREFNRADKAAKGLNKTLAAAAATTVGFYIALQQGRRIVGEGFGFVKAAADFEESFSKFSVVFGAEAGRIQDNIAAITAEIGRSTPAYIEQAANFQNILTALGFATDQSADFALALTQLTTDLASFNNVADNDAAVRLLSGIVGETEAVRRFGVDISDVAVKAKALELGLKEVNGEFSQQQKVLARLALIFENTTSAQGDALRTQASYVNQTKRLQSAAEELRVTLGTKLVAVLKQTGDELGGVEAITKDVEFAYKAVSVITVAFIRTTAELIRAGRDFIAAGGGQEEVLKRLGSLFASTSTAVAQLARFMVFLTDTSAIAFRTFGDSAALALNNTLVLAEDTAEGLNTVLSVLGIVEGRDFSFGGDRGVTEKLSFGQIFEDGADDLRAAVNKYDLALSDIDNAEKRTREAINSFAGNVGKTEASKIDTSKGDDFEKRITQGNNLRAFFDNVAKNAASAIQATDELAASVDRVGKNTKQAETNWGSFSAGAREATDQAAKGFSDYALGFDLVAGAFGALDSNIDKLSRDIIEGKANFSDFAKSIIKDIGAMIVKFLILRAVRAGLGIDAAGDTTGGGLLGLFEKGGVSSGPMVGRFPVKQYANGGIADSPQVAIFGEGRQREAFVPLPDGRRIPVDMRGDAGSGKTLNVTLNVSSLDPRTAADVVLAQMPEIQRQLASAIESGSDRKLVNAVRRK